MFTKTILITILLISIAQTSCAKPKPVEDVCLIKRKYAKYLEPSDTSPHNFRELLTFTSTALLKLTQKYVQGGRAICDQLLKNDEIINSKSMQVLEFKKILTMFEEDYDKCDGLNALDQLAQSYYSTTSFYFDQDEASFDADSKFILSLLRKYKSDDLNREFEKSFDIFLDDFYKIVESLKEDLTEEKSNFCQLVSDWFANFKRPKKSYDEGFYQISKNF